MDRLFSILGPLIPISIFVVAILHLFGLIDVWEAVDRVFDGNPSVTEIDTTKISITFTCDQFEKEVPSVGVVAPDIGRGETEIFKVYTVEEVSRTDSTLVCRSEVQSSRGQLILLKTLRKDPDGDTWIERELFEN